MYSPNTTSGSGRAASHLAAPPSPRHKSNVGHAHLPTLTFLLRSPMPDSSETDETGKKARLARTGLTHHANLAPRACRRHSAITPLAVPMQAEPVSISSVILLEAQPAS